jgi:diguanylate cyclase (GGDEF)-like protein
MPVPPRKSYFFFFSHIRENQRLHWNFLIACIVFATIFPFRGNTLATRPLSLILVGIVSTVVFAFLFDRIDRSTASFEQRYRRLLHTAFWQVLINLALITYGIHISGGPASPLPLIYILYLGSISVFFPARPLVLLNGFAILFYTILIQGYINHLYLPVMSPIIDSTLLNEKPITQSIQITFILAMIANGVAVANHSRKVQSAWQDADEQNIYLDRLNGLTHLGLEYSDLDELYQTMAEQSRLILGTDAIYITRWDGESGQVFPAAASNDINAHYLRMPPVHEYDPTMTQSVLMAGKALIARDVFCTPYLSPRISQNFPTRSMLGVPMYGLPDRRFLGALLVAYHQTHDFSSEEIKRAEQLANMAALLISRTRLYDETLRRAVLLEELAGQITRLTSDLRRTNLLPAIVESARSLLKAKKAALHLRDPKSGKIRCEFSTGLSPVYLAGMAEHFEISLEQQVLRDQNFVLIPDVFRDTRTSPIRGLIAQENFRAYAVFPLESPQGSLGTLSLYWDQPHAISSEEVEVGRLFAQRAGAILHSAHLYEQVSEESLTDVLTSLPNRRYIDHRLLEESQRSGLSGSSYAFLMIDLDGFKTINDSFGHPIGDSILQQISIAFRRTIRSTDVIARYGGDEFAVILPEAGVEEAVHVAEKLRSALTSTRLHLPNDTQRFLSACFGIAIFPTDSNDPDALIRVADERLYQAKHKGTGIINIGKEN